jgi:hypothetical protein
MADVQSTQGTARTPEQSGTPTISNPPEVERGDKSAAAKVGRTAVIKGDQPVARLTAVTITIDSDSAEIVRIEGLDTTGARHELSQEEKASLMKGGRDDRLAEVVERAFEAGIACVLGDDEEETTPESPADAELRHLLLAPLIKRSTVGVFMEREALNRAILGTLIEHSAR